MTTPRHKCHWPTCDKTVPPKMWGCRRHWMKLPKQIRVRIWLYYRVGQEVDKKPSRAYLAAVNDAQQWAMENPDQ